MGWLVQCSVCSWKRSESNIVNLIRNRTDDDGWFKCAECNSDAYIEKKFDLQEPGGRWEPYLRGMVCLGEPQEIYQPFVFLVSYKPKGEAFDVWFSYYKDTRESGGRLKLGYGPGGPPVLGADDLLKLFRRLIELGCIDREKAKGVVNG